MDIIYESVIDDMMLEVEYMLDRLRQRKMFPPKWTDYQPIGDPMTGTNVNGVYKILYKPEERVYYIGQGKIGARKTAHNAAFREGVAENEIGKVSRCMYEKDPNMDNWHFSFCDAYEKSIASQYEARLIALEDPEFNSQHMAGVS